MEEESTSPGEANRRIMIPAIIATIVLLVGGFVIALTPYLIFHSRQANTYDGYHTTGPIIGLLALVPANVWALSVLRPRTVRKPLLVPLLVLVLTVLSVLAAGILFWTFAAISLSTVDWFVF